MMLPASVADAGQLFLPSDQRVVAFPTIRENRTPRSCSVCQLEWQHELQIDLQLPSSSLGGKS